MLAAKSELHILWKQYLEQWQLSGLSIAAWCRENNIPVHCFYYWRNKLTLTDKGSTISQTSFIEIVNKPADGSGVFISIGNVAIHLAKDFDKTVLIDCLQTLRAIL